MGLAIVQTHPAAVDGITRVALNVRVRARLDLRGFRGVLLSRRSLCTCIGRCLLCSDRWGQISRWGSERLDGKEAVADGYEEMGQVDQPIEKERREVRCNSVR